MGSSPTGVGEIKIEKREITLFHEVRNTTLLSITNGKERFYVRITRYGELSFHGGLQYEVPILFCEIY
jgi:hypothetical protein